jgi:hypothetical protein
MFRQWGLVMRQLLALGADPDHALQALAAGPPARPQPPAVTVAGPGVTSPLLFVIKPHFPEQTASFPRHAPLFPDTLTLLLGPRHAWILVNFSQIMVDCTG